MRDVAKKILRDDIRNRGFEAVILEEGVLIFLSSRKVTRIEVLMALGLEKESAFSTSVHDCACGTVRGYLVKI